MVLSRKKKFYVRPWIEHRALHIVLFFLFFPLTKVSLVLNDTLTIIIIFEGFKRRLSFSKILREKALPKWLTSHESREIFWCQAFRNSNLFFFLSNAHRVLLITKSKKLIGVGWIIQKRFKVYKKSEICSKKQDLINREVVTRKFKWFQLYQRNLYQILFCVLCNVHLPSIPFRIGHHLISKKG